MKFLANLVTRHYKVTLGVWIILFVALAFLHYGFHLYWRVTVLK